MARPRKPYIRTTWKLSLPAHIAAAVDMLLFNPLTNKPQYGDRSTIVAQLLQEWLDRMKPEMTDAQGRIRVQLATADHIRYVVGEQEFSYDQLVSALKGKETP